MRKTVALASGASQTGFGRTGTVDWQTGDIKHQLLQLRMVKVILLILQAEHVLELQQVLLEQ